MLVGFSNQACTCIMQIKYLHADIIVVYYDYILKHVITSIMYNYVLYLFFLAPADKTELFGHLPPEPEVIFIPPKSSSRKSTSKKLSNLTYPDLKKPRPKSPAVRPLEPPTIPIPPSSQHPTPPSSRPTSPIPDKPQTPKTVMSDLTLASNAGSDVQTNLPSGSSEKGKDFSRGEFMCCKAQL